MVGWFREDQQENDPPKPGWMPFHDQFPFDVWNDFETFAHRRVGLSGPKAHANVFTVVSAALSQIVGADDFRFFDEMIGLNRPVPYEEKQKAQSKARARQEALSPVERTRFLVSALRIYAFSRSLTRKDPIAFERPDCLPPFPKEASRFWFDPTAYPAYSGGAYLDSHSRWTDYIIEIAKQPLSIDEALATDFLRIALHKNGRDSFFCSGVPRHVVAHVRKNPGPDYLAAFRDAAAFFASPEGLAISRTSYQSKARVQLREMVARNLHHIS